MFAQIWMGESILVRYRLPAGIGAQMNVYRSGDPVQIFSGDDVPQLVGDGFIVNMIKDGTQLAAGFYRLVICTVLDTFNNVSWQADIQVLDMSAMSEIEKLTKQIEFIDQKLLTSDPLITRYRSADGREIYRERGPNLLLMKETLESNLTRAIREANGSFPGRSIPIIHSG